MSTCKIITVEEVKEEVVVEEAPVEEVKEEVVVEDAPVETMEKVIEEESVELKKESSLIFIAGVLGVAMFTTSLHFQYLKIRVLIWLLSL